LTEIKKQKLVFLEKKKISLFLFVLIIFYFRKNTKIKKSGDILPLPLSDDESFESLIKDCLKSNVNFNLFFTFRKKIFKKITKKSH